MPCPTCKIHSWWLWLKYLQFLWHKATLTLADGSGGGAEYTGQLVLVKGQRQGGLWCGRVWSDRQVEVRMAAVWWSQRWWHDHHNDGSYLVREEQRSRSASCERYSNAELLHFKKHTHTLTVEACLCFPSTTALTPACPGSRDWTSCHTWDTNKVRQTHKQICQAEMFDRLSPFRPLECPTKTDQRDKKPWLNLTEKRPINIHILICPIMNSTMNCQNKTQQAQTGWNISFSAPQMISHAGALSHPGWLNACSCIQVTKDIQDIQKKAENCM